MVPETPPAPSVKAAPASGPGEPVPPVSVIIPLEFHRGQAGDCLERWLNGQTWPRRDFEVILACPPDFPQEERRTIQAMMAPQDRLVEFPLHHDIALVEAGARLARGDYFFFTESHVLPEPDTLEKVMRGFRDHPEWAGFSLQSIPIIHNFLSRIEAEFYEMGIRQSDDKPDWCQVLDQCFAVRRGPYFEAGGFPPDFGHYGEWVLAARLHTLGYAIGYYPEGRIHHYYIGERPELEEFTADFAAGHWRWFSEAPRGAAHAVMQAPPLLARRHGRSKALAAALAGVAAQAPEAAAVRAHWFWAARGGLYPALARAHWQYGKARWQLWWRCLRKNPAALQALIDLSLAIVDRTHLKILLTTPPPPAAALTAEGSWSAEEELTFPSLGFYGGEEAGGARFQWTQPAAMVELDLPPGRYHLELGWLPLRKDLAAPRIFLNEQPVPEEKLRRFKYRVRCSWHQKDDRPLRLAWTCPPVPPAGDPRLLGLPLARITWHPRAVPQLPQPLHAEVP